MAEDNNTNRLASIIYNAASDAADIAKSTADATAKLAAIASGLWDIKDNTLSQSEYDFKYRMFPEDLANDYHGHYMVININVPVTVTDSPRGAFTGTPFQNIINDYSKVDVLRFGSELPNIPGSSRAQNRGAFSVPRFTKRIKESIALYMPSGLLYNSQNKYEEISLTALGGKAATGAVALAVGTVAGARGRSLAGAVGTGAVAGAITSALGQAVGTASALTGYPINPRVEVLYSHTDLRSFRFEVLLAPRSYRESQSLEAIIKTLRFHAAPEIDSMTQGFTFIPPAEFDITFYNKGVENTKIPRINTCVLNVIEVDYAPSNGTYSTFSNGHPVAVRLSLGFSEVEPLHKTRILQGF